MKQSAVKTLGVAALGAAFAAAGAGAAHAAPALPDATGALETVTAALPVEQIAHNLPTGAPEALEAGQRTLSGAPAQAQHAPQSADPVRGLLGGLPVVGQATNGGLPTQGLPLQGLPVG
ncbi:ATP-binding protein [Streptomyces sp. NPDC060194]|uniref:ATP-binding protein n=1 Tax=Streptomyces sp. NPDC060194 TaxID=3347069 RepID=UPI003647E99A